MRAVVPILLGVIPFGMISGASAVAAGLSLGQAVGMSVVVFAGAAQLAAVELLAHGASPVVVVLTAWVINLRFMMYSASLAPWLRSAVASKKLLLSYLLTDQAYAVSLVRFEQYPKRPKLAFYLGAAATLWGIWQLSTLAGALLGSGLPPALELEFAIPLTFIALMVPMLNDRPRVLAALTAGVVALAARELPYNLGLMIAAAGGVAIGLRVEAGKKDQVETTESTSARLETCTGSCQE